MILRVLTNTTTAATALSGFSFPDLPPLHPLLLPESLASASSLRRLYLACALTPYRRVTYLQKGKERPAVEAIIREGLKLGAQYHYLDGIPSLFLASEALQKGLVDWEDGNLNKPERVWIGANARSYFLTFN